MAFEVNCWGAAAAYSAAACGKQHYQPGEVACRYFCQPVPLLASNPPPHYLPAPLPGLLASCTTGTNPAYTISVMAQFKVKVQKTMFGDRYTFTSRGTDGEGTPYTIETTIAFAGSPMLVWNGTLTKIDEPGRFGAWGTPAQKREYCRRFAEGDEL